MKIWKEKTAFDFLINDAWCVDERLSDVISDAEMFDEFNQLAENTFPDGANETALNDWLRFEDDSILSSLGLEYEKEEEEANEEI